MSKESDLDALADDVRPFVDQEIPTVGQWNENPTVLEDALHLIGDFFTLVDAAHAALLAKFNADHDPTTGENPTPNEWVPYGVAPSFVHASSFSLSLDRQADFRVGDRIRIHQGIGGNTLLIVAVTGVAYSSQSQLTSVTVRAAANDAPLTNPIASVDLALIRDSARRVGGFDLVDGAINEARQIADDLITLAKLADGCIDRDKILAGEVVAGKLGPAAVQSANIANANVVTNHLGPGAVTGAKIASSAVGVQHIGEAQIIAEHFTVGAVNEPAILDGAVTANKLGPGAVTNTKLGTAAVTTLKIADGNVTPAKLRPAPYRGHNVNGVAAGLYMQHGWTYATIGSNLAYGVPIVFPEEFPTQVLSVRIDILGIKSGGGAPSGPTDTNATKTPTGSSSAAMNNLPHGMPQGGSMTRQGFTALVTPNNPTNSWATGDFVVFSWTAMGN